MPSHAVLTAPRRPTFAEICTRLQTLVQDHAAVVSVAAQAVTKVSICFCPLLLVLHSPLQRPRPNFRTCLSRLPAASACTVACLAAISVDLGSLRANYVDSVSM